MKCDTCSFRGEAAGDGAEDADAEVREKECEGGDMSDTVRDMDDWSPADREDELGIGEEEYEDRDEEEDNDQ